MFLDANAINISLKNYNESQYDAQLFTKRVILKSNSTNVIIISDVHRLIKYFIIQTHTFQTNIFLSNTTNFSTKTTVNGTNNGLVQRIEDFLVYKFYTRNMVTTPNASMLIMVVAYRDNGK